MLPGPPMCRAPIHRTNITSPTFSNNPQSERPHPTEIENGIESGVSNRGNDLRQQPAVVS